MGSRKSAGIVVVRRLGLQWQVLLLRAFDYWDFPKGGIEIGEGPLEAAVRETREETALTDLEFRWGEIWTETEPYASGKIARYYLAESVTGQVRLEPSPSTGRPEHQEYRWLSLEDAQLRLVPRTRRVLDWARRQIESGRASSTAPTEPSGPAPDEALNPPS